MTKINKTVICKKATVKRKEETDVRTFYDRGSGEDPGTAFYGWNHIVKGIWGTENDSG